MFFFLKVFELLGGKIRKESSSYCIVRLECSRESSELDSDDDFMSDYSDKDL